MSPSPTEAAWYRLAGAGRPIQRGRLRDIIGPVQAQQEITGLGAAELAARIADQRMSSTEVVNAHIERIREVNGRLNALVFDRFERARTEAAAADEHLRSGAPLGPLHGVPITVKDQFLVEGTPTTLGVPGRMSHRAAQDGPLVARLRDAGAIVLGKTNVSQLLVYPESDNPAHGRTCNPWDLERTPGGSSGGEAALIAAGGSPLGLAGDLGGSIRTPAHFTGLHGLKPTAGRLPNLDTPADFRASGQEAVLAQPGVIARHVADLTLAFSVLAGPGLDRVDPTVPPVAWRDPTAVDIGALCIAVYDDDGAFPASPAIRRATREAAQALRGRGATVVEWRPPALAKATRLAIALLSADGGEASRRYLATERRAPQIERLFRMAGLPDALRPVLGAAARAAGQPRLADTIATLRPRSADGYWRLLATRAQYRERFFASLDAGGFDLVICPPLALPAFRHGTSDLLSPALSYALLANLLGMPAGVVAATRVRPGEESDRAATHDVIDRAARRTEEGSAGLPVGVQVLGRPWREDQVLAAMDALEIAFRAMPDYPRLPSALLG